MAADKGVSGAEAMRQSMLELIDKGADDETQPAFWAPFCRHAGAMLIAAPKVKGGTDAVRSVR